MPFPEIMTIDEVAEYLRVSSRTVYEWAQKGEIPCGKLGTNWRFKRSDIEAWVDRKLKASGTDGATMVAVANVLAPERVVFFNKASKVDVLEKLVETLGLTSQVNDVDSLRKAVLRREELMSTGIGMGVAVPHVRLDSVSDIVMAAAIVHEGIEDYETLDNVSVKLVFMIAATPEQHAQYLRLLSSLSKHLKNEIFRHQLIDCESGVDFYNKLGQEK